MFNTCMLTTANGLQPLKVQFSSTAILWTSLDHGGGSPPYQRSLLYRADPPAVEGVTCCSPRGYSLRPFVRNAQNEEQGHQRQPREDLHCRCSPQSTGVDSIAAQHGSTSQASCSIRESACPPETRSMHLSVLILPLYGSQIKIWDFKQYIIWLNLDLCFTVGPRTTYIYIRFGVAAPFLQVGPGG